MLHMPWFRNGTSKYLFADYNLRMGLSHKLHMEMYIPILSQASCPSMGTHSSGIINEGGRLHRGGSTTPAHARSTLDAKITEPGVQALIDSRTLVARAEIQ